MFSFNVFNVVIVLLLSAFCCVSGDVVVRGLCGKTGGKAKGGETGASTAE